MEMNVLELRQVFDGSQHLHKHQKCLKRLQDLYQKYSSSEAELSAFKAELRRDILFALNCEPKSPYTKHSIEFIANFLRSISDANTNSEPTPDSQTCANTEANAAKGDETDDDTIIDESMAAEVNDSPNNRSDQENRKPDDCSDSEVNDELGMESLGSESFSRSKSLSGHTLNETSVADSRPEEPTFADIVLKEQLIRFLFNIESHIRYNCCVLIRKLFANLEDMDLDVYKSLKMALLERIRDRDTSIRSVAALALHRFQEPNESKDVVRDALRFHLKSDPDYRVRQSCLQALHPSINMIDEFISATRDVKDIIRKTAFILIADKFEVKNFGIDKRLQILKNGLNERHSAVKKVVETKLLPNWVKSYNADLVDLLYGLDIQSDPALIEKMLYSYFNQINNDSDESTGSTGFHKFLEEFRNRFLENHNLLTKEELTVENSFLWRIVAQYCKDNDITVTVISSDPNPASDEDMGDSDSQPNQIIEEKVDAIDNIVPDLPHYCRYLNVFVTQLSANEYEIHELMEFEFMFKQLLLMGELIEIGDEAQRQILRKCIIELLSNEELFQRLHDFVPHLMKIFAQNTDLNMFLDTTVELIDKINSSSMEVDEQPVTGSQPTAETNVVDITEQLRQFEIEYAKLSVRIEELKDYLETAERNDDTVKANELRQQIDELNTKMNEVMERRLRVNASQLHTSSQQSSQQSQNDMKKQKTLTEDPIALERCLQIFCGCLQFGNFKAINAVLLTLIERLVIPSIPNNEMLIRSLAIKTLGLSCLMSSDLAKKYFALFIQFLNCDSGEAQEFAMKCVFDILCAHGLSYFEQKSREQKRQSLNESKGQNKSGSEERNPEDKENKSNNCSKKGDGMENESDEDNDRTIIDTNESDVLCSESENDGSDGEEAEEDESFITLFTDLLEKNLYNECENICVITAKGIAKLFILGRMYSPQLLSKMIILWYDPDSCEELRQFLGVFLPIYSGIKMKSNLKGENAFEECFVKTVETVYTEALNYVNLDNLINFMTELISDDGHKNLAKAVANQMLTRMAANGVNDTLSNKYYLRVLSILRLNEMTKNDIKEYKLLVKKIEKFFNKLKFKTKLTTNRIQTIKTKIDKQIELIKQKTSEVSTIEDFGSLSLSQSLSERSQIDETFIETDPQNTTTD